MQRAFQGKLHRVVFILGGPGAGKTTQCRETLKINPGLAHFSAGELLREAAAHETPYAAELRGYLAEGKIVPDSVTVNLLRRSMQESKCSDFLIDGFPRRIDQFIKFEEEVAPCAGAIFLDVPEHEMESRLLLRSRNSNRSDDNPETIRKRFKTYMDVSYPAIEHLEKVGKLWKVNGLANIRDVNKNFVKALQDISAHNKSLHG